MALGLTPYQIIEKGTHPQLVIADEWERVELKNIASVQNGFAFSSKLFSRTEGLPLIRIRDIFSSDTENLYTGEYNEDFIVTKGDILIGMDGDFKVSKWPGNKGLLNQRVCRIHFDSNHYEKEFLFICIQPYLNAIHSETSAVTVKHLSSRTINDIPFPLPPLPEQRAIVAKIEELFSDLDKGIADLKKAQDQLKVYRQAVLKKAFEGELTKEWREQQTDLPTADTLLQQIKEERQKHYEQELENWKQAVKAWEEKGKEGKKPGKPKATKSLPSLTSAELAKMNVIPKTWGYSYLAYSGDLGRGKSKHRPRNDKRLFGGKYPFFQTAEVKAQEIITEYHQTYNDFGLAQSKLWPAGTLCITIAANIADTGFLGIDACFPDSVVGYTPFEKVIDIKYIDYFFRSAKARISAYAPATAQKNINLTTLENLVVPFCSKKEQIQVVQEIESRLSVCDKVEESITESLEKAKALRQSILKKAFEGTLLSEEEIAACKSAPDYEPASVLLEKIKAEKKKK
ncbi:MAG: restriction endonuclease subunit S [Crocinitomicaceae bacterium]|nr:restriction endonuclease subunit S [Crocinitomicaceae bacterium]